ncbi:uncharacterized protein LOC128928889 isoform X2 [Callithrix jacchus]|uniref:uncharacterized protein LOC128928889 isoform X2 n=1 Tax=Callithrix jacchus TaxID=9483 RepID=UPI0023DCEEEA|nr:uncharacterized protein LOC128928889 isoform X2 [Callithrix jacchus]
MEARWRGRGAPRAFKGAALLPPPPPPPPRPPRPRRDGRAAARAGEEEEERPRAAGRGLGRHRPPRGPLPTPRRPRPARPFPGPGVLPARRFLGGPFQPHSELDPPLLPWGQGGPPQGPLPWGPSRCPAGLRIGESSDPDAPARKSMRREGGFPDGEKQVVSEWLRDGCSLSFGGKQSCGLRSPSANAWHGRQVSQKHQNVPGSWEAWGAPPTLLPLPPQKQDELHSENPVDTS